MCESKTRALPTHPSGTAVCVFDPEYFSLNADRDALAAQVRIMRSALEKAKPHVRVCYKQGHAEWSDFESVTGALEFLPQHHLAAHDNELAKDVANNLMKIIKPFFDYMYGNLRLDKDEELKYDEMIGNVDRCIEQYAAQPLAKAGK